MIERRHVCRATTHLRSPCCRPLCPRALQCHHHLHTPRQILCSHLQLLMLEASGPSKAPMLLTQHQVSRASSKTFKPSFSRICCKLPLHSHCDARVYLFIPPGTHHSILQMHLSHSILLPS